MKNKFLLSFFILMLFVCIVFVFLKTNKVDRNINENKIKSVNLSTDYEIEQVLKDIKELNVNAVNVPIVIEIPNLVSNDIKIDEYSKEKAIKLVKILKKQNLKVNLEPYPWINNGSDYETEYNPKDKDKFFSSWKNILKSLIEDVGNKYNVDVIITASNLSKLESYEDNWCEIIDFVKHEFSGLVTYKTQWWYTAKWDEDTIEKYNDKLNNQIFSHIDFISIAAYFELSSKRENTVDELVNYLRATEIYNRKQDVVKEIYNFYKKYNKKIYFGELGFPRSDYAAFHPWNDLVSDIENDKEQARCFEAYKRVFEDKDYIKGFSVFAVGKKGEDKRFYPSNESIEVISGWYRN